MTIDLFDRMNSIFLRVDHSIIALVRDTVECDRSNVTLRSQGSIHVVVTLTVSNYDVDTILEASNRFI